MRGGNTGRKEARTAVIEVARTRKQAAFLATLRQAAESSEGPGRPTRPVAAGDGRQRTREAGRQREALQVVKAPAVKPPAVEPPAVRAVKAPAVKAPAPQGGLFREEALKHRLAFEEGRGLVRVSPPWTWALLWTVVLALAAALAASFVGEVEVTGRGRGILRPAAGVRVLTSQLTGTVTRIEARSGDHVKAGTALVRIESPTIQAELLEAERQLEAVRTQFAAVATQQDHHYAEQIENLNARAKRLTDQIASLRGSSTHFQRRVEADAGLLKKGLVSEMAVGESRDALAQAERQLSSAQMTLDQTRQELATLESRRQDELWQRQQQLSAAQNKRDAIALVMQQSVIQAPEDGAVEGLLVKVGEQVQAAQVVGKLIPVGSPLHVVSFLAERDRAFAKPGDEARLELDQLPTAEFGALRARVVRIGDDLASPFEIREALGDEQKLDAPSYRVELEITDAGPADSARVKLRTGTLMNVRYTLRRQRLVTLVFNPLRKWFR